MDAGTMRALLARVLKQCDGEQAEGRHCPLCGELDEHDDRCPVPEIAQAIE